MTTDEPSGTAAHCLVVVFDTSVLITLSIGASRATHLFARLKASGHRVAVSPQILAEVGEKMRSRPSLRKWLRLTDEEIEGFLHSLPKLMDVTAGVETAAGAVPADPKDDMIIAAAVESGATYIVSEDHHLRDLKEYEGIKILGIDDFKAELDRLGVAP
jgi:putative PIN family toxin of toxin-antitoxin system